ncbi:MAG: hypothetical protein ACFE0Q_21605 [Anaerolineae bacterium]
MSNQFTRWVQATGRNHHSVLLIGNPASPLAHHLYQALDYDGHLSVSLHDDSGLISACTAYNCYVLDGDHVGALDQVMKAIQAVQPRARILVISDSYDWEDARQAFRLGAIEVLRTPANATQARAMLARVLRQHLPQPLTPDAPV